MHVHVYRTVCIKGPLRGHTDLEETTLRLWLWFLIVFSKNLNPKPSPSTRIFTLHFRARPVPGGRPRNKTRLCFRLFSHAITFPLPGPQGSLRILGASKPAWHGRNELFLFLVVFLLFFAEFQAGITKVSWETVEIDT